jgi:hypothetical protein
MRIRIRVISQIRIRIKVMRIYNVIPHRSTVSMDYGSITRLYLSWSSDLLLSFIRTGSYLQNFFGTKLFSGFQICKVLVQIWNPLFAPLNFLVLLYFTH